MLCGSFGTACLHLSWALGVGYVWTWCISVSFTLVNDAPHMQSKGVIAVRMRFTEFHAIIRAKWRVQTSLEDLSSGIWEPASSDLEKMNMHR
ncbi:hypothetical protein N657DRAFT_642152 [Parathielavia appendiculata]|uniref:Uncharacterized protein n=1 Tax=Parathielavia appendiculata TaxID=2587402 RepID=A0AAN6U2W3_9PEZI|nr:hypothetical protein N657DRAFT_642152 [Parathielavia appendiculata]